mgnify:FL=1
MYYFHLPKTVKRLETPNVITMQIRENAFFLSLSFLQTNRYFRILSQLNDLREKAGEAISAVAISAAAVKKFNSNPRFT